jgi:hypothetical protein
MSFYWNPRDREYRDLKKAVDGDFFYIDRLAQVDARSWLGALYPDMWRALRYELEFDEPLKMGRTGGSPRFVFEFDLRGKPTYVEVEVANYGSGPEATIIACHEIEKKS